MWVCRMKLCEGRGRCSSWRKREMYVRKGGYNINVDMFFNVFLIPKSFNNSYHKIILIIECIVLVRSGVWLVFGALIILHLAVQYAPVYERIVFSC